MATNERLFREITPISEDDFFIIKRHNQAKFDFPVHIHPEYELNLVLNASGKRIIGDSITDYSSPDLVLIGADTPHAWLGQSDNARVITLQFHSDVLSTRFLERKCSRPIKEMFDKARLGVHFSREATLKIIDRLERLPEEQDFNTLLELLSIIYELATSEGKTLLSSAEYINQATPNIKSRRINRVNEFINANIHSQIKIEDVAELINMSPSAFSHFFKRRTSRSFTEYLTAKRIGLAANLLVSSEKNISEICFDCGFGNISNFNRAFKSLKGCTPKEFRDQQRLVLEYGRQRDSAQQ